MTAFILFYKLLYYYVWCLRYSRSKCNCEMKERYWKLLLVMYINDHLINNHLMIVMNIVLCRELIFKILELRINADVQEVYCKNTPQTSKMSQVHIYDQYYQTQLIQPLDIYGEKNSKNYEFWDNHMYTIGIKNDKILMSNLRISIQLKFQICSWNSHRVIKRLMPNNWFDKTLDVWIAAKW